MKKKIFILNLISLFSVVVGSVFLIGQKTPLLSSKATNTSYQISFNSSKNKFHSYTGNTAYDGTATIQTDLGNDVSFNYYQVKGISTTWHVLGSGGYFYNVDPIHGIDSIVLSFKTNDSSYTIYYSQDDSFDQHYDFVSSNSEPQAFNFNNYKPNYFKVVNTSGANFNISSINISLSCQNNYPSLTVVSENTNMGNVTGGGIKTAGESVTINAYPLTGYRFVGWFLNDSLVTSNVSYTFIIGNNDLTYVARFTYRTYNFVIETESNEKGTVSNSTGTYDYLSEITIEATANEGYTFEGWYNNDLFVSSSNPYTFSMPHENITYCAKFSTNTYSITLNNLNSSLGNISGNGTFLYKQNVTLIATPNTGVSFLGWYDSNDNLISSLESYSFDMPHDDLVYFAKFEWTPYSVELSINNETMGSVSGSGSYIYQQEVILSAYPNEHYSFAGWYENNNLVSMDNPYVFNLPNRSLNFDAKFVRNYNIYVYSDNESMGTVDAPLECGAGLETTVIANAKENDNYLFDYWYDDDLNEVSYDSSFTFIMPEHDVTLHASFVLGYTLTLTSSDISKGTVSGSGLYKSGSTVTAVLNYVEGIFKGWFDINNNIVSDLYSFSFTMPSNNVTLEAVFMTSLEEAEARRIGIIPTLSDDGKTITYGLYPQKVVDDSLLTSELDLLSTPESNGWYLYDGDYYAKINAFPYDSSTKFDNGTTIVRGTTYWFKCEPIVWKVLSNNNGEYYLLSNVLLDKQCYHNSASTRTIDGKTVYASNYEHSDIRNWLNSDFYNSAFALNNKYILTTTVDNSISTIPSSNPPKQYVSNNTFDKVFLPSLLDYLNVDYGFVSVQYDSDPNVTQSRWCATTDWSKARGLRSSEQNNGWYCTRSPSSDVYSYFISHIGSCFTYPVPEGDYCGVRPAIMLSLV